jgi:hypothetical protein
MTVTIKGGESYALKTTLTYGPDGLEAASGVLVNADTGEETDVPVVVVNQPALIVRMEWPTISWAEPQDPTSFDPIVPLDEGISR